MKAKAKVTKSCDFSAPVAAKVLEMLNPKKVSYVSDAYEKFGTCESVIVTDVEPCKLIYPEGWYYAKGAFRNKHTSSTGFYSEIVMLKSNGDMWGDSARYCTLYDD